MNATVVHPTGIMGPEDFSVSETTKTVIEIIQGKMPAGIDGSFNLCDVRDLADGLIAASEKGRQGECYILGNEPVTFRNFVKILVEQSHCKKIGFFLPIKMAYFMANRMEKKQRKLAKNLCLQVLAYGILPETMFLIIQKPAMNLVLIHAALKKQFVMK